MKSISLTSVAIGLLLAQVEASPAPVPQEGSKCSANNCLRAVRAGSFPNRPTAADCSSFLLATVTPATYTETVWATITPVTETATTTSTSFVTDTQTSTDQETVDVATEYLTTTVTPAAAPTPEKRDALRLGGPAMMERQVTVVPTGQPAYASSCSTAGAYASACSCIGIFPSTTTVAVPTTVVTSTVTATASVTIGVVAIVTETASRTITETVSRTVTSQATYTASERFLMRLLSDDANVNGVTITGQDWSRNMLDILKRTPSGGAPTLFYIDPATSDMRSSGDMVFRAWVGTEGYRWRQTYMFKEGGDYMQNAVPVTCSLVEVGGQKQVKCGDMLEWGWCQVDGGSPWLFMGVQGGSGLSSPWSCVAVRVVAEKVWV